MPTFAPPSRARAAVSAALIALVGMLIALLVPAPALAAVADDEAVGISLRPADASGAFDGRSNFRYDVDPGQTINDFAAVVNTGAEPQIFTLIGTDAFNNENGDYALLDTDAAPEQIGRWVTFENGSNRMEVTLNPGEGRLVPFALALPAEATPGDHAGGIVASVVTSGGQVELDRRVAIRLYARVAGDLQPRLTVSNMEASYSGDWWNLLSGTVTVSYTVENVGNVALAANVKAGLNTWFGIPLATPSAGRINEILPRNSASYQYELAGIAQWGYLNPHMTLAPFVDNEDPTTYVTAAPVTRDTFLIVIPWLVLIALLLAGAIVVFVWWRRRREDQRAQEWIEYTQEEARKAAEKDAELVGAVRQDSSGG